MGEIPPIDSPSPRALSHPIRIEILRALRDGVASSHQLSEQLGARQDVVAYHAKVLVQHGCLQLLDSAPRRGAVDNYFGVVG
ncbi:MAG TPA: winged helix-turn-helix domain-containing protein [Solirubrobacterales bacterium]|nr:winged helix-turn-helix domain-containing protein [Solirubrobacterales bacterium]